MHHNPEKSKRMFKKMINTSLQVRSYHLKNITSIKKELEQLIKHDISIEHVLTILSSWHFYQVLIKISSSTNLKGMKNKVKRLLKLKNEISQDFYDNNVIAFTPIADNNLLYSPIPFWKKIEDNLNRVSGSPFSKDTLTKQAYFELLFIAESLGLASPTQNYKSNDLKSFLRIILNPFAKNESPEGKSFEHYYQKYKSAKQSNNIHNKLTSLIEECVTFRFDIHIWQMLIVIYQDEISQTISSK